MKPEKWGSKGSPRVCEILGTSAGDDGGNGDGPSIRSSSSSAVYVILYYIHRAMRANGHAGTR